MSDSTPGSAPDNTPASTPGTSPGTAPTRTARKMTPVNPYAGALGLIWIIALIVGAIVILWSLSAGSTTGVEWAVFFFGVAAVTALVHLAVNAVRWQAK